MIKYIIHLPTSHIVYLNIPLQGKFVGYNTLTEDEQEEFIEVFNTKSFTSYPDNHTDKYASVMRRLYNFMFKQVYPGFENTIHSYRDTCIWFIEHIDEFELVYE